MTGSRMLKHIIQFNYSFSIDLKTIQADTCQWRCLYTIRAIYVKSTCIVKNNLYIFPDKYTQSW